MDIIRHNKGNLDSDEFADKSVTDTSQSQLSEEYTRELESIYHLVSHDLRAPLRIIDGFSCAILEDYSDNLELPAKEYLQKIRNSSQQMGRIIENILNLAKIYRSELQITRVDLSQLANEVVDELTQAEPGLKYSFLITDGIADFGDKNLLKQVYRNLLGEALKFTKQQIHPKIEFGMTQFNGNIAYYVRDNGIGYDTKCGNSITTQSESIGKTETFSDTEIGMATVQRIINRLGGRIWVEGNFGQGATFYFTLDCSL